MSIIKITLSDFCNKQYLEGLPDKYFFEVSAITGGGETLVSKKDLLEMKKITNRVVYDIFFKDKK